MIVFIARARWIETHTLLAFNIQSDTFFTVGQLTRVNLYFLAVDYIMFPSPSVGVHRIYL